MGKHNGGKTWFDNGGEAISVARSSGCSIRRGKGDHVVICPSGYENIVVVDRPMGRGLGCKIWKMFKLAGLVWVIFTVYGMLANPDLVAAVITTATK